MGRVHHLTRKKGWHWAESNARHTYSKIHSSIQTRADCGGAARWCSLSGLTVRWLCLLQCPSHSLPDGIFRESNRTNAKRQYHKPRFLQWDGKWPYEAICLPNVHSLSCHYKKETKEAMEACHIATRDDQASITLGRKEIHAGWMTFVLCPCLFIFPFSVPMELAQCTLYYDSSPWIASEHCILYH